MRREEEKHKMNSPVCEEASLKQASESIVSLISTSYAVILFPAKWRAIRDKLEHLCSCLIAASDANNLDLNPDLLQLSKSINSTSDEAMVLVERCCDEDFNGGKLLLKSDIDLLSSKLDQHAKDLNLFYLSRELMQYGAIVVSRPGLGASREDMRFYVKDLFSRLRIGDSEMKSQALVCINEIFSEDEKHVKIVTLETDDAISLLVNHLEFEEINVVEEAVKAVSVVAGFDSYKAALVAAGVIAPLIRVLETGSILAKERAAGAMKKMTENLDNLWSVSAHGGVTALIKILADCCSSSELVGSSCRVLRNLSSVEEIKRFMVEEGLVSVLANLVSSEKEATQLQAIEFLLSMANGDDDIKQKAIEEGIIEKLVNYLDPYSTHSSKVRETALRAIDGFYFSFFTNTFNPLLSVEFLEKVVFFLKNGELSVQESAVKVTVSLSLSSEDTKKAMGELGFMAELVRLLEAKSLEVRIMSADALCNLVSVQKNRKKFIQEDHNISRIMGLLNPEDEKKGIRKSLLPLIMCLSNSSSGRRKITASGYVKNLEKLADSEVGDAKKIVKKLSGSRFRNIMSGMWGS